MLRNSAKIPVQNTVLIGNTPPVCQYDCSPNCEACDRYIKSFKQVKMLYGSIAQREISLTLDMSERLVNEYIALIEEKKSLTEEVHDFI